MLVFGTTGTVNKRYPLDQDSLVIGKGRGCDLVLEAPDISAIHGVITRNAGGYSIRDCDSRSGIRVNGDRITAATLHDGDMMQLGPFSFKVILPPQHSGVFKRDTATRLIRLERKRNNLVRLALTLRRRVRQEQPSVRKPLTAEMEVSQLMQQSEMLHQRMKDCEQRAAQLEQAERALAEDRAVLAREMAEFEQHSLQKEQEYQDRVQELENSRTRQHAEHTPDDELRRHQQELEQQLVARRQELADLTRAKTNLEETLNQRRQELEEDFRGRQRQLQADFEDWRERLAGQLSQPAPAEPIGNFPALDDEQDLEKTVMLPMVHEVLERTDWLTTDEQEESRRLLLRRRELDFFRQHLQRLQERLREEPKQLGESQQELDQATVNKHPLSIPEQKRNPAVAELLERHGAMLERAEAVLVDQGAALANILVEFRQLHRPAVATEEPAFDALLHENAELRQRLEESEQTASRPQAGDVSRLRELEQLRGENELLQQLLAEKENELSQARQQNANSIADMPAVEDVDSYEAELVQFRRQVEMERATLNRELEALRARNEELDDATREVEMELSRERAEMARERMRLDRMREEIQADLERLQRNGGMNERLAPVQKLREEIAENRQRFCPGSGTSGRK
jgi:pSer/pThr/pTyr-binding forkhead associated (FHA) protein